MLTFFWWGAQIVFANASPPADAMDVYAVGKQWMWKIQYPEGHREINELHVPVGPPGEADAGFGGRHPQLLSAGLPPEAGRGARALHDQWFKRHQARPLSSVLLRVLRHQHSGMVG